MDLDTTKTNELGQAIGGEVADWKAPPVPSIKKLEGEWCQLEALDAVRHSNQLYESFSEDKEHRCWTYMSYGPFRTAYGFQAWMRNVSESKDPLFFGIRDKTSNRVVGVASYLRIDASMGSIEVGHINYSPALQRTRAGTEAMYLMMKHAFELGYRRYEWKCDSLNAASRHAADRYGFKYEGLFRQALIYKGRNRDTAWFSIIDREWPGLKKRFETWLEPSNFDDEGVQKFVL